MTKSGDNALPEDDALVEELLARAAPRPTPAEDVALRAKEALRHEWQHHVRRRVRRRRTALFAAAATVVLAVAVAMNTLFVPVPQPVRVATLEKSFGTIYFLGEQAELQRAEGLEALHRGQTIVTGDDAGVGLRWAAGGSLRLGADTEVEFAATDRISLASGRVYYDSLATAEDAATLTIVTPHGEVTHVGTQFIAASDVDTLTISVREGRVSIDGHFHDVVAEAGQQLRVSGSRRPVVVNITGFGPEWEWVEATAPIAAMQGKKLYEFLVWVSRETGLEFRFESDDVERVVRENSVAGDLNESPRVALRQSLMTADLVYDIDNGIIRIRQAGK